MAKTKEEQAARYRAWAARNKEKCLANSRRSAAKKRAEDPEGVREKFRAYCAANPDKVRKWALRPYGITPAEFDAIHAAQGGRCPVCLDPIPATGKGRHLDHNHDTGVIRGILCVLCNLGLGKFRDNPAALRRAAEYVETANTGMVVKNLRRLSRPNSRYTTRSSAAAG